MNTVCQRSISEIKTLTLTQKVDLWRASIMLIICSELKRISSNGDTLNKNRWGRRVFHDVILWLHAIGRSPAFHAKLGPMINVAINQRNAWNYTRREYTVSSRIAEIMRKIGISKISRRLFKFLILIQFCLYFYFLIFVKKNNDVELNLAQCDLTTICSCSC